MDRDVLGRAIEQFQTPFYLFDTNAALMQIKKFKSAFGANVEICYAMKANPFLVGELCQAVDWIEACSPGEFNICQRLAIPTERIVLSGVYKNKNDVCKALERYGDNITFTIESVSQWTMLVDYAIQKNMKPHVILRLTNGNQFGMDEDEIYSIIAQRVNNDRIQIEGIQYYSSTQKKSFFRMTKELQMLDAFFANLCERFGFRVRKLEYGPGFPVNYFDDKQDTQEELIKALSSQLQSLQFGGRIVLELGRIIAADSGYYITEVVDTKYRKDNRYCIVNGGIHQINYYGHAMAMKQPPVMHWDESGGQRESWSVFGALCTMNDVLLKEHLFSGLHVGSRLVFEKTGAYSVTEGMALFLSRELPQVVLYSKNESFRMVRDHFQTDLLNSPIE